ncbi:MAG: AAA family ATPase [Candidatus Freyarchaeota archaeon]
MKIPAVSELKEFLEREGLFYPSHVVSVLYAGLSLKTGFRAFLLRGPAGTGKTSLTEAIARIFNANYIFYQCTLGTSEDELLYKFIPSEETKSGIKMLLGPLPEAVKASREGPVVLVLDEFDKTRPSTDALLLDFLQTGRVSVRIDENETIIQGKRKNLIVFLTSNDERDFSEPLLRRVIQIKMPFMEPKVVYRILFEKTNDEKIATLLTQVYVDTINAGCRKPATVQELLQLAEAISVLPNAEFNTLIRSFIIKDDEDWQRYVSYVQDREPYQWNQQTENEEDIASAYKAEGEPVFEESDESEQSTTVSEVLSKVLPVRKPVIDEVKPKEVREDKEVFALIEDNEKEAYTEVIKKFRPEPGDDPARLGKFTVYFDDMVNKAFVVSESPLSFSELFSFESSGEYYAEGEFLVNKKYIDRMIEKCNKVHYYTASKMVFEFKNYDEKAVLRLNIKPVYQMFRVKAELYVKGNPKNFNSLPPSIHEKKPPELGELGFKGTKQRDEAIKAIKTCMEVQQRYGFPVEIREKMYWSDYELEIDFDGSVAITIFRTLREKVEELVKNGAPLSPETLLKAVQRFGEVIE